MPVTVPTQRLRSTVQSGSLNNTDAGSPGTAVLTTKVQYGALAVGVRKFVPNTTATTTATIPAVNSAPTNAGWRMSSDIVSGERVRASVQSSNQMFVGVQQDSGSALTVAITVICFLDGVEIARGTSDAAATTGTTTIVHTVSFNVSGEVTSATTNPRLSWEIYCTASGLNLNAISAVNISLVLNISTQSNPSIFAVDYNRTTNDTPGTPADTATRTFIGSRTTSESTTQIDTARRSSSLLRVTAEVLSTMAETAARQALYQRLTSDSHAMTEVATRTQVSFRRSTENYTIPTDSAQRTVSNSRTTGDTNIQIDTAQKTITYQRVTLYQFQPQDDPPSAQFRAIRGFILDEFDNPYTQGATVMLIRDDGIVVQTTTSDQTGAYVFPRNFLDTHTYTVAAFATISGSPYQAITERGLVPV